MKRTHVATVFVVALLFASAACTGDGNGGDDGAATGGTAGATGATGATGPAPVRGGSETAGTYEYANAGLRAILELDGSTGTLEVENGTDHELADPGFYARHALTGARTDGVVADPTAIPPGETATFGVQLDALTVGDVGVIGLLFGDVDYGLFVRTA